MFERTADRSRQVLWVILALSALLLPVDVWGSNKLLDMRVIEDKERYRAAFFFDNRPSFQIRSDSWKGLALTFFQTDYAADFLRAAEKTGKGIILDKTENSGFLSRRILLEKGFQTIDVVWLPEKKILILEITLPGKIKSQPHAAQVARLQSIRLGTHEKGERVAMKLSHRPPWKALFKDEKHVNLELEARASNPMRRKYGPTRRLAEVALTRNENPLEMVFTLIPPWSHARLFWFEKGERLVLDLLEPGGLPIDEALLIPSTLKSDEQPPSIEMQSRQREQAKKNESASSATNHTEKADLEKGRHVPSSRNETGTPADLVAMVRQKIGPRDSPVTKAEAKVSPPPNAFYGEPTIEPALEEILPDTNRIREWSRHLSSGEAFLFGRILEAWEMKDYEKGATLIQGFMEQYPQSPLGKPMAFLRGDFLLHLLKSGRRDILPLVTQGYQEAINRYGDAKEAPGALIKMAQASSYAGNDYAALSYLNTALARYGEGDHLPLLYVTRGMVYLRLKQPEKAIENFKIMINRFPNSPLMNEARYWIATYYHNKGVFKAAEEQLHVIERSDPEYFLKNPGYLFLRALNYFYMEDFNRARLYLLQGLNMGGQPERGGLLLSRIGDTHHHQKDEEAAQSYYKAAVDFFPEGEGASIARLRLAQYADEVKALEEVGQRNANKPIGDLALLEVANAYFRKGDYDKAMETSRVLMTKPTHLDISRKAKQLYSRSGEMVIRELYSHEDYEKIVTFYRSKLQAPREKMNPEVLYLVAQAHFKAGHYGDAVPLFESIRPYDLKETDRADFYTAFAESCIAEGDMVKGIRLLESSQKEKFPMEGRQRVSLMLAGLYERAGDKDAAYQLLQSVVSEKRDLPVVEVVKAYLSMGRILNGLKLYEKSRGSLMSGITLAEKDRDSRAWLPAAYMMMGDDYYHEGRSLETIKAYREGLNRGYSTEDKDYWKRLYRLAVAHLHEGEIQEAERIFVEILEEGDPNLEQMVQIKLGMIGLDKQLKRLPL